MLDYPSLLRQYCGNRIENLVQQLAPVTLLRLGSTGP
jgi:hypothetical protein